MTLLQKINMCLALWNPDVGMHSASEALLSRWYNQQMEIVEQAVGMTDDFTYVISRPYLSYQQFRELFSLPNSDYRHIPVCIQQDSMES